MWGCGSQAAYSGYWGGGGFFLGPIFSILIWILVILLLVRLAMWIYSRLTIDKTVSTKDRVDSLAILQARFARGDVSEEEFLQMKSFLARQ